MSKPDFRPFVPRMGAARYFSETPKSLLEGMPPERIKKRNEKLAPMLAIPFKGVTADGQVEPDLFALRDEGAPTLAVLQAVRALFNCLTPEQLKAINNPIESTDRHRWVNGIPRYETFGLWLDEMKPAAREVVFGVLRASLSEAGYEKSRAIMMLNGFLGELVGAPDLLGEFSYQIHFFGEPSPTEPWGWQLFGHHLCLTCFIVGTQMTLTPTFMGAEPRYADAGPLAGLSVFDDEERYGLDLVRNLSAKQQRKAILYETILPNGLPPGRHQGSDGMIFTGYYKDNAIVPYKGISGADLDAKQRRDLLYLTERYLTTLPEGPLRARMEDVERHIARTHFCWAGGTAEDSVFYYRIQSPVVLIEFDHHKGVLFSNDTPQRFHTHTIVRTPNGNDYGMDLLRLHYATAPHHGHAHGHSHDHGHGQAHSLHPGDDGHHHHHPGDSHDHHHD